MGWRSFAVALILFYCVNLSSAQAPATLNLIPVPKSLTVKPGRMVLDSNFHVSIDGPVDTRLEAGIQRVITRLERMTGVPLSHQLQAGNLSSVGLQVRFKAVLPAIPKLGQDESYSLEIAGNLITLNANEAVGVLRGLETLVQLLAKDQSQYYFPEVSIQDAPRFQWRGLMIDVSRHFEPLEVIYRNLDAMAAVKLNVFHWHLSDDQGFRVESKKYPKLQELGSDDLFYTQEQIKSVIRYAADRGIRVVPEFDMPGHATSWFVGYPDLASAPGPYQIERHFGIFDPAFNPTDDKTYKFLDEFLGEMAGLFPDEYLHIGGDESNGKQWDANPKIQEFKKNNIAGNEALQTYFTAKVEKILRKHGKKTIGWDEVLQPGLPNDVVVQSWRGSKSLIEGAKKGYSGILSQPYYLDQIYAASRHNLADPLPPDAGLTPEQANLILGGEACMWAEYVTPETIDSRIWPRMAAVAERFWSPQSVANVDDMYRRMDSFSVQLENLGLAHLSHTPIMLRRMTQTQEIDALLLLAGVLQPATFDQRSKTPEMTQLTPMVRMSDAANPDPPTGRVFAAQVKAVLDDAPRYQKGSVELTRLFADWHAAVHQLRPMIANTPVLQEIGPRVEDWDVLATIGSSALNYLQAGKTLPPELSNSSLAKFDEAEGQKALLRFVIIEPLRQLVLAASAPRPAH